MPDYSELLSRIEQASGPDRELDVAIAVAVLDPKREKNYWMWQSGRPQGSAPKPDSEFWGSRNTPTFTASLDSTVALVERMLPGCEICLTDVHPDFLRPGEPKHLVELMCGLKWVKYDAYPEPKYETTGSGKANSRPLALLTALFRALSAREAKDGE